MEIITKTGNKVNKKEINMEIRARPIKVLFLCKNKFLLKERKVRL